MARTSEKAICKEADINALQTIVHGDYSTDLKRRAQCILYSSEGRNNKEAAELTGLSPNWVGIWIKRYNAEGIDGISDRPRSGRKGGDAVPDLLNKIREKLEGAPPEGEQSWNVESIAKALGLSPNSIRNAIRGTDITFDRKRIWNFETNGELVSKNLDVVGFYCSNSEKALVLSASRNMVFYEGTGSFATRNKNLADELTAYTSKKSEDMSLSDVLSIATEHNNDDRRFSEGSLSRFLDELISSLPQQSDILYSVFLFGESCSDQRMLHHAGIQFLNAASMEKWQEAVESFITLHCDSVVEITRLKDALARYLDSRTNRSETFKWKKQLTVKSSESTVTQGTFQTTESQEDNSVRMRDENESIHSDNSGEKKSRVRITFEYFDEDGNRSSASIEVDNLKNASECDTSSKDSIMEFVSELERCVLPAVDKGTQILGELAMQAVKKNSQLSN